MHNSLVRYSTITFRIWVSNSSSKQYTVEGELSSLQILSHIICYRQVNQFDALSPIIAVYGIRMYTLIDDAYTCLHSWWLFVHWSESAITISNNIIIVTMQSSTAVYAMTSLIGTRFRFGQLYCMYGSTTCGFYVCTKTIIVTEHNVFYLRYTTHTTSRHHRSSRSTRLYLTMRVD